MSEGQRPIASGTNLRARLTGWAAASLALCVVGCAHQGTASDPAKTKTAVESHAVAELRAQLAERERRLTQLENRLALLEAEQRQLRYAIADRAEASPPGIHETVRIGRTNAKTESVETAAADEAPHELREPKKRSAPRPVLRLYEAPAREPSSAEPLMPIPVVSERLPVVPMPGAPVAALPVAPVAAEVPQDPTTHYRRAVELVRARAFEEALIALNEFLVRYPADDRAPKVMFWRGEVLFAQREYAKALDAFESVLSKDPRGDRAADALLKVGLCHKRLGAPERARAAIERLKTQFPNSDAARLIAEEDA